MILLFGCCSLLLLKQRPSVIRLIDCWVLSEFFETALQCWVCWDEGCQMVSLQWLEPSVCLSVRVSGEDRLWYWTCRSLFSEVSPWLVVSDCLFWITAVGTDITACLSQLFGSWVHWWRRVLCCDDVVKTENLDWIFLLDVSLLWGWPVDASVMLSTSGNVDLFQIY